MQLVIDLSSAHAWKLLLLCGTDLYVGMPDFVSADELTPFFWRVLGACGEELNLSTSRSLV